MNARLIPIVAVVCLFAGVSQAQMMRVGENVATERGSAHPYAFERSDVPRQVLSETLHHPAATYIQVHFSRFQLAEGDHVIVRSPDGAQSFRYEGLGRGGYGLDPRGFWSRRVLGESAIVELHSDGRGNGYGYQIDMFTRGYDELTIRELNPGTEQPTAICGGDDAEWAPCYELSEPDAYQRAQSLSRLHLPGGFVCTGWLVGCEGHMMTNNHCIADTFEATNTEYEFGAEGATCTTSCFSSNACQGVVEADSATLISTSGALDYSLVKLPNDISSTYGFLTLRPTGPEVDERIYIPQHPAGWGRRIAIFSDNGNDGSGFCEVQTLNAPPCTGGPGDVGYYCDTQGGSSGSPVLGYSDHRVVALHHCANCPNRGLNILDVIDAIGGDMPGCALDLSAGVVQIDNSLFSCSDVIGLTVLDDSLQGAGSQIVTVSTQTETTPEVVTLTETNPGVFVGSIPTTTAAPVAGDGLLSASDADTVVAQYIDADDGNGGVDQLREDSAGFDCIRPQLLTATSAAITTDSATIGWQTDEDCHGEVHYGLTTPPQLIVTDGIFTDFHGVALSDLEDCEQYLYSFVSTDAVGNVSVDDNGGSYHSLTTACLPPIPVPAGGGDTAPMTVEREDPDSPEIRLHWDEQCARPKTNLLYGPLDQIGWMMVPSGSRCDLQSGVSLDDLPDGSLWLLLVGENKLDLESSWGLSSSGERKLFGSSGQCGTTLLNPGIACD